jgi:hypothetical protein
MDESARFIGAVARYRHASPCRFGDGFAGTLPLAAACLSDRGGA